MNRKRLIAWVSAMMLAFGWVTSAQSDTYAPEVEGAVYPNVGIMYTVCNQFTGDAADCTASDGDEAVVDTFGFKSIVVDFSDSTATTLDCDLVGNNVGHDATTTPGTGETMNTTAFSTSLLSDVFTNPPRFVWIYCTETTGGYAHATILGRK